VDDTEFLAYLVHYPVPGLADRADGHLELPGDLSVTEAFQSQHRDHVGWAVAAGLVSE
jgi:hypothetical protein